MSPVQETTRERANSSRKSPSKRKELHGQQGQREEVDDGAPELERACVEAIGRSPLDGHPVDGRALDIGPLHRLTLDHRRLDGRTLDQRSLHEREENHRPLDRLEEDQRPCGERPLDRPEEDQRPRGERGVDRQSLDRRQEDDGSLGGHGGTHDDRFSEREHIAHRGGEEDDDGTRHDRLPDEAPRDREPGWLVVTEHRHEEDRLGQPLEHLPEQDVVAEELAELVAQPEERLVRLLELTLPTKTSDPASPRAYRI